MRHCRFKQMTRVVQFVAQIFFFFPTLASDPVMRLLHFCGPKSIEITIFLLRISNDGDKRIQVFFQFWIFRNLQSIRSTLDDFIEIGVIKCVLGEFIRFFLTRSYQEIINAARLAALIQCIGNSDISVHFYFWRPKIIHYMHLRESYRLYRIVFLQLRHRW